MSASGVAAQRGTVTRRPPWAVVALALTILLAIALAVSAILASRASTGAGTSVSPITPPARIHASPAKSTAPMAAYRDVVADLKAAESRHDFAAQARFGNELKAILTTQTIGLIRQEHARLESYLATARAHHEYHAASMINQRISALCGPKTVRAQLDFCN